MNIVDRFWFGGTTGFVVSSVTSVVALAANQRLRRVLVKGNLTFQPKPTNVFADDGIYMGIVAVSPAVAPGAPTLANASQWAGGWWGRPAIKAAEKVAWPPVGSLDGYRWHFELDLPYSPDLGGAAGALYLGTQQLYVDANHLAIDTSYTVEAWGWQS